MFLCFFPSWVALAAALLTSRYCRVVDVSLVATPTAGRLRRRGRWRRSFSSAAARISTRFFPVVIALASALLTFFRCRPNDISVDAAPTIDRRRAMYDCFFFGRIATATFAPLGDRCRRSVVFALVRRDFDNLSVNATPTRLRLTMLQRFVFGGVARTEGRRAFASRFAVNNRIALPGVAVKDDSVDAAPTTSRGWRRWRRRRHISRRWGRRRRRTDRWRTSRATRKRPVPTRRRLRWTRRMFTRRSAPFVATAIRLPAPAPAGLFPNPLATFVVPLSTRDFHWRESECVFVAIAADSVADNDA